MKEGNGDWQSVYGRGIGLQRYRDSFLTRPTWATVKKKMALSRKVWKEK